jgi:hypothetical protein
MAKLVASAKRISEMRGDANVGKNTANSKILNRGLITDC